MNTRFALAMVLLVACGSSSADDDMPPDDAVPRTIVVTGTAVEVEASGASPLAGVLVEAFDNRDEATAVTSAMSDAQGNFTLTITTNDVALDGYLKATFGGLIDTYLYPATPLTEDFEGASINLITSSTLGLLTSTLACNDAQASTNGMIAMQVYDAAGLPVTGAVLSSSPAASSDCYNGAGGGLPKGDHPGTAEDGIGYLFNVTGQVTVSAIATGLTFPSHQVKARPNTLTTTQVRP